MKLTIRRGGGIAGVVARTELDAAALPEPDAAAFAGAVDRAALREPHEPAAASRWPDSQLYEISLEEAGPPVSVHFTDETLPEDVRRLLAWVDGRPERVESIEP
ncbi:protealysin inhibitor emfourin [Specibacter sp. RAF43]|uniref:protealysin inhibitor emfourin n=1 Tax=Specibacter sp. RAF43 TaxID=3233057 RepID=UPI003F9D3422